jgi:hypothetical protein
MHENLKIQLLVHFACSQGIMVSIYFDSKYYSVRKKKACEGNFGSQEIAKSVGYSKTLIC